MTKRELHDGESDGLTALEPLDLDRVKTFADLLRAMEKTAFAGRALGEALDILVAMTRDEECLKVATLAGAMTIAKQGKVLEKMIRAGMVDIVVSTGALMAHGLAEGIGAKHYKHDPKYTDEQLFDNGYNRVYDTLEMEKNLDDIEKIVAETLRSLPPGEVLSSRRVCSELGRVLSESKMGGVLAAAYENEVPVYIPAFTDSEMGLDTAVAALGLHVGKGLPPDFPRKIDVVPNYNPFLDLNDYAERIVAARRKGIFTIGGGVPRNWAQQVGPYVDLFVRRLGLAVEPQRFSYGIRICPEPTHWGGLSGCTYTEGVSWGKFVPVSEGGRYAEVYADATIAWPILVRAAMDVLGG
jgi:deoxyhypusine synthase